MATVFHRGMLRLGADHPCLPGHFPGAPVFPGVLVLEALADALRASRGLRLRTIHQVKYLHPWQPGDEVELQLHEAGTRIGFTLQAHGRMLAQGQLEAGS